LTIFIIMESISPW